nr:hypothetical protein [Tanacetum cinerariifolium]
MLGIKCSKAFPLLVMKIPLLEYFVTVSAKEFPLLSWSVAPAKEFALLDEDKDYSQLKTHLSQSKTYNEHYALWEVIEFGDSYQAPLEESGKGSTSESSAKNKGRIVSITTEDMQNRRNDVKARTTLLLVLPDEHQLRFSKFWKKTGNAEHLEVKTESYMAIEEENHALVADEEVPTEFALMVKLSLSYENEVEARLVKFKTQEIKFCEKIRGLERDAEVRNNKIKNLMNELEQVKKEKEGLDSKLTGGSRLLPAQVYSPPKKDMSWTRLPEFADDTVTDYSTHTPSIDSSKSNTSDLQNSNPSVSEHGESSDSIMSKPMIKFVKAADSPGVIKTNKTETSRKPPVKYVEMYRNTSKSPKVRGNQRNWNNLKSQQL